jgi:hypothetical protein
MHDDMPQAANLAPFARPLLVVAAVFAAATGGRAQKPTMEPGQPTELVVETLDPVPANPLRQADVARFAELAGPPHQVIEPPAVRRDRDHLHRSHHRGAPAPPIHHPPLGTLHRHLTSPRAIVPGAAERPVWKRPYSYGYFGARGKRHWSRHYGYRDRYTQWTLSH